MYDLAIIGGGPAGYSAAFEAIHSGLSVIIFEKDRMGGTCLNRGCVPTKYLSHMARVYKDVINASDVIKTENVSFDYDTAHSKMMEIISSLRMGIINELKTYKGRDEGYDHNKEHDCIVEIIEGKAIIEDARTISCGKEYEAKNILIATGSQPAPSLLANAVSSDELLNLTEIPAELHILGGGSIAVEFANIYRTLGSDVSLYIRGERILRGWDKEIAVGITQSFKKKGIKIHGKCDFSKLEINNGIVLSAAGRIPVLPSMPEGLLDLHTDNSIIVNSEAGETETAGVYAAGDVIKDSPKLAHIAMEQGRNVVRHILGRKLVSSAVVKCLYLDQEVATVRQRAVSTATTMAKAVSAKVNMYSNARTKISTPERGFIKITAEKQTGQILEAQMMCERASDLIVELALAINQGLTCGQMLQSIRPHPSYSEAVTEALRLLENKICSSS